jgi:hypothetical protein
MTEIIINEVGRICCMDEKDVECPLCRGLTAVAFCEDHIERYDIPHNEMREYSQCVHCGNPLDLTECKIHKPDKKADAPRFAK